MLLIKIKGLFLDWFKFLWVKNVKLNITIKVLTQNTENKKAIHCCYLTFETAIQVYILNYWKKKCTFNMYIMDSWRRRDSTLDSENILENTTVAVKWIWTYWSSNGYISIIQSLFKLHSWISSNLTSVT